VCDDCDVETTALPPGCGALLVDDVLSVADLPSVFVFALDGRFVGYDPASGELRPLPGRPSRSDAPAFNPIQGRTLELSVGDEAVSVRDSGTGLSTALPTGFDVSAVNWIEHDLLVVTNESTKEDDEVRSTVWAHRVSVDGSVVWSVDLNPTGAPVQPSQTVSSGDQVLVGLWYIEGSSVPATRVLLNADGTIAWSGEGRDEAAGLRADGLIRLANGVLVVGDDIEIAVPGALDIFAASSDHVIVDHIDGGRQIVSIRDRRVQELELPAGCVLLRPRNTFVGLDPSLSIQLVELIDRAGFEPGPGMHDLHPTVEVIDGDRSIIAQSFPVAHTVPVSEGDELLVCEEERVKLLLSGLVGDEIVQDIAQRIVVAGLGCTRAG